MSYVLDLRTVVPEKKEITIDDRTFDITIIPAEFAFETYDFIPLIDKLEKTQRLERDEFLKLLDMYFRIFKSLDDSIDYEWLRKRVNFEIFGKITPVIFNAIFATSKKNEGAGEDLIKSI